MPSIVKYAIKSSNIITLEDVMEENMLESNVDLEIMLGKEQRKMSSLTVSNQNTSSSRLGDE